MVTIGFNSNKGGNCTTTSVIEVATALKGYGYRVLVIDTDSQLSLTKNITDPDELDNVLSKPSIFTALKGECSMEEAIQHTKFFDLVIGSQGLDRADKEFAERDDVFLLSDLLSFVADDYDFTVIDSGPAKNFIQTSLLIASDYIILNCEIDASNYDAVITTEQELKKLVEGRNHDSHAKVMGYIIPRFENINIAKIIYEDVDEHRKERMAETGEDIFLRTIPKSKDMSENKSLKTASCLSAKSSKCARAYFDVADEIIRITGFKKGE